MNESKSPQKNISESPENSMTPSQESLNLLESAQSATSVAYWMKNYVYLQNENLRRTEKWQAWEYLIDLLWVFLNYNDVLIEKARQLGISWLVNAYAVWRVNFFSNAKALVLSQGQEEANEMVSKAKFIYEHMPEYMQQPRDRNRTSWLYFGDTYSELKSLPSTDRAGTGYNATLIIRDELYNHPSGEANFMAVAPATDAGGQMIDLSAVYGDDLKNHFVERINQIYNIPGTEKKVFKSGMELYTNKSMPSRALVFLPWQLRPVRLEGLTLQEFYDTRLKTRYTEQQLDRQYPSRIEDALRVSLTGAYFEVQALDDMGYDTCTPIKQSEIDTYNGIIRIYKPPITGRQYVEYTDPSDGRVDPFVTGVMDYVTGEVVCSASGKVRVSKAAEIHDYLARKYNNATNSYEANAVGIAFAQCLDDLKTPNQSTRRNVKGDIVEGRTGYYIDGDMRNKVMFPDLAFGIAHRKYVVHDMEFIQQAKLVTRELERQDRLNFPVTPPKQSFDWVMMMNGLVQLCKHIPRGKASYSTYAPDAKGRYVLVR